MCGASLAYACIVDSLWIAMVSRSSRLKDFDPLGTREGGDMHDRHMPASVAAH